MSPPALATVDVSSYLPVALIILMAVTFGVLNLVLTKIIGPSRQGRTKGLAYESGMNPVGTALSGSTCGLPDRDGVPGLRC